jgi:hypothetical protein
MTVYDGVQKKNEWDPGKTLLVINWRQKSMARSQVKLTIEDMLDGGLPRAYSPDLYKRKCTTVFEHVYEKYGDAGQTTSFARPT